MRIRHTITLWVAGTGLVSTLCLSLIVFFEMREQPYKLLDSELATTATFVGSILEGIKQPKGPEENNLLAMLGKRYWVKVYDRNRQIIYRSELASTIDLPLHQDGDDDGYTVKTLVARDQITLHRDSGDSVIFRVREIESSPLRIQIAKPIEGLREEELDLAFTMLGGIVASSLLLVVLSYLVAGRIVKPIGVINDMTKEINEKTLDKRLPHGKSHDEIYELTHSLNRMFDRLQYSFIKQKEFLANASHELKTPLAMLRLFFDEMMQYRDLPEEIQQQINGQHEVVLRMERLVKTLLELSVLELDRRLELEELDMAELCRSVLEDFAPLFADRRLTLLVTLPAALPMKADKDKIRRLLINLFDNAVKYTTAPGEIQLQLVREQHAFRLSLSNTHPQIPPEEIGKFFEQFYRQEKSRSLQHGGAGLGLAISKEIVRLHGGQITMESGPGDWVHLRVIVPT